MTSCTHCEHLQDLKSGRQVRARCPATGITFPAVGVHCKDLCADGERIEISPDTFSCACYSPKKALIAAPKPPHSGVRVVNGRVIS